MFRTFELNQCPLNNSPNMDESFDLQHFLKKHEKHKSKPVQFTSVAGGVKKRLESSIKHRKSSRLSHLDSIRNLPCIDVPQSVSEIDNKVEHRRKQMEKWKEEKERKKREAAAHKRKPFVTGIVHPPLKYVPPPPLATMPSTSGRVTRSQSKVSAKGKKISLPKTTKAVQSFAPINASFKPPKLKDSSHLPKLAPLGKSKKKKVDIIFDPVVPDKKLKSVDVRSKMEIIYLPRKSAAYKKNTRSKSKETVVKNTDLNCTPKTPEQLIDLKNISPCVTLSRGKDNARKEMKKKMEEGLFDEDISNIENVGYFRMQLDSEVQRITEMCNTWEQFSQEVLLSEAAMEELLSAVGQGRLLVSQKLAQFGSLVAACERPEPGAALVSPTDLHGFWDMLFMQVENVDMRFKKLTDLRDRNWIVEELVVPVRKVSRVVKNNTKSAASSSLRNLIAAARKAKKEQSTTQAEVAQSTEANGKSFEAGFFSVRSPVKSPRVSSTPSKPWLLKDVLSNEAKKASASKNSVRCLAMVRASFSGRSVESPDKTATEISTPKASPSPSRTPSKSILKSANVASTKRKKSVKSVLFGNSEIDSQEIKEAIAKAAHIDLSKSTTCVLPGDVKDIEEDKENKSKAVLRSRNALDGSPILTRSRRKSMNTPLLESKNIEHKRRSRKFKVSTKDTKEI